MKRGLLVGLTVIFLLALTSHWWPRHSQSQQSHSKLELVPRDGPGWKSTLLPVGTTEAASASVAAVLHYDDVFYREYASARIAFTLYAAFWGPGKMPTQIVASHTPDRCWSSAGWRCTKVAHATTFEGGGKRLLPSEVRVFVGPGDKVQHVAYWHLVGDHLYDYGERFNQVPSVWRWWRDVAEQIVRSPPEQYFIRIASDRPFAEMSNDPAYQAVVASLSKLGLGAQ
jgi:hypothetical protein